MAGEREQSSRMMQRAQQQADAQPPLSGPSGLVGVVAAAEIQLRRAILLQQPPASGRSARCRARAPAPASSCASFSTVAVPPAATQDRAATGTPRRRSTPSRSTPAAAAARSKAGPQCPEMALAPSSWPHRPLRRRQSPSVSAAPPGSAPVTSSKPMAGSRASSGQPPPDGLAQLARPRSEVAGPAAGD